MTTSMMNLKILLPFQIFAKKNGVKKIVIETNKGHMGFLPHRLDCVAVLIPSIICYQANTEDEVYIAIDEGIFIKTENDILISVRNAISGSNLKELHQSIDNYFLDISKNQKKFRFSMQKMETNLLRRFASFKNE